MVVISLLSNYKTTVTTVGLSLAYKSQRKTMNKGRKNRERGNVRKREQREGECKKQKKAAREESRERRTDGKRKQKRKRKESEQK
jgi:hypothetical protein